MADEYDYTIEGWLVRIDGEEHFIGLPETAAIYPLAEPVYKRHVRAPAPAHTDHPLRHHDRTCPACNEPAAVSVPMSAAYATTEEWHEMMDALAEIQNARTNGDAFGAITRYRFKLRTVMLAARDQEKS